MSLLPSQETRTWVVFMVVISARVYRTMLLTLVMVALVPTLFSWSAYVVSSGSMEPSIAVGDVAVGKPFDPGDKVAVGRVYMYEDPTAGTDRTMVHRIVERRDDGDYTTAGDANDVTDLEPLTTEGIEDRAILLVPYIGKPIVWWQTGAWLPLAIWLLLTLAAFVLALRYVDDEPPRWTLLGLLVRAKRRRRPTRRDAPAPRPPVNARRAVIAATTLVVGVVGAGVGTANATFTAHTASGSNSWQAGQWLLPYVKAVLDDSPTGFWLLDETTAGPVVDRSGRYAGGRTLGTVTRGVDGALTDRNPGTAYRFGGGRAILHDEVITGPEAYSVELWFRTTADRTGYLIGFESSTNNTSFFYDRSVLIDAQGRLQVGEWGLFRQPVTTPDGYRDGGWHHLVVTATPAGGQQDVTIYVDGTAVASGRSTGTTSFQGHWRIGSGSAAGFLGLPRRTTFTGDLDAVAVYQRALTAAEVQSHYDAR